jgi:membrane fusion protein (multidrug efflux system)
MMSKRLWRLIVLLAALLLAGGLVYCCWDDEEEEEEESVGEYRTLTISTQDYTVVREFTSAIETRQTATIYPEVSGRITKICVKEGQHVKKGQPIVVIDQVPYQAAVDNARARVGSAKAQRATAAKNLEGKEILFAQHVIGDFDLAKARNEAAEAEAALAEAEAELKTALNELSYTVVKSPSDGVMSMISYRVGELIGPEMQMELTTISDPSDIYVYLGLSEKTLYDLAQFYGCSIHELPTHMPEVTLTTYWGKEMEHRGRVDAISGNVEEGTGAVYMRASFDNSEMLFRNGSNATLHLPYHLSDAIVIPQEATFDIQDKIFVYKVEEGVTRQTEIKVLPYHDGQNFVVTGGLAVGDIIIAEGAGLLRDGMQVKIKE